MLSPRSEAKASGWLHSAVTKSDVLCAVSHTFVYWSAPSVRDILFFSVDCGIARFLCATRVFEVWTLSSHPRLPLCQNLVSFIASVAEVTHAEKSRTQSLTHSPSLFDARGTEAFASENGAIIK